MVTTVRLDAATLEKLQNLEGRVLLCDEEGQVVLSCMMTRPSLLEGEPDLSDEEWKLRAEEQETYSTAEVLETLRRIRTP